MSQCIFDYGVFQLDELDKNENPNEHDYILHLTFGLLIECCQNEKVPPIISRILLNNLTLKLSCNELVLE